MYNFDPYNVLSISTNISVLLMTASVLQGHILLQKKFEKIKHFMWPYYC